MLSCAAYFLSLHQALDTLFGRRLLVFEQSAPGVLWQSFFNDGRVRIGLQRIFAGSLLRLVQSVVDPLLWDTVLPCAVYFLSHHRELDTLFDHRLLVLGRGALGFILQDFFNDVRVRNDWISFQRNLAQTHLFVPHLLLVQSVDDLPFGGIPNL